jgi:hypothetical protein
VEKVLDHVDNINVTMRKTLDGVLGKAYLGHEGGQIYGQLHTYVRSFSVGRLYF